MLTASSINKNLIELKLEKAQADVLVINISYYGFEMAAFTKSPHTLVKIAETTFKEPLKHADELSDAFLQFVDEYELKKLNYKTILVNWMGDHFTLVPSSFYNADNKGEVMVVVEAISDKGEIGYQELNYEINDNSVQISDTIE